MSWSYSTGQYQYISITKHMIIAPRVRVQILFYYYLWSTRHTCHISKHWQMIALFLIAAPKYTGGLEPPKYDMAQEHFFCLPLLPSMNSTQTAQINDY